MQKDLTEKLMKAHSIDNVIGKNVSFVGEVQRGNRIYRLYVSPSQNAEEDKYFYQVFILRDGNRLTEYEAIFNRKEKKSWSCTCIRTRERVQDFWQHFWITTSSRETHFRSTQDRFSGNAAWI